MTHIDYEAPAEIFTYSRLRGRSKTLAYHRFGTAEEALRYAIEEIPKGELIGTIIEVEDDRIGHKDIRKLYKDRYASSGRRRRRYAPRRRRNTKQQSGIH